MTLGQESYCTNWAESRENGWMVTGRCMQRSSWRETQIQETADRVPLIGFPYGEKSSPEGDYVPPGEIEYA